MWSEDSMQQNCLVLKRWTPSLQGTSLHVLMSPMLSDPHRGLVTLRVPAEHAQSLLRIVPDSPSMKAAVGQLHRSLRRVISLATQRLTSVGVDSCTRVQCLKIEGQSTARGSAGADKCDMIEHCSKNGRRTIEDKLGIVSK